MFKRKIFDISTQLMKDRRKPNGRKEGRVTKFRLVISDRERVYSVLEKEHHCGCVP